MELGTYNRRLKREDFNQGGVGEEKEKSTAKEKGDITSQTCRKQKAETVVG